MIGHFCFCYIINGTFSVLVRDRQKPQEKESGNTENEVTYKSETRIKKKRDLIFVLVLLIVFL